jgi:RsiW-degrading membrane proteinase PrsW (M82 family)
VVVVAAFLLMGALAPFTEEMAKLLGPLLVQRREGAPVDIAEGRRRAWRRGVCAGAGFGAFEAVFYGGMVFSPLPWVSAVALRACTTVMHAVFGGAAALGWRLGTVERRIRAGLGLAALAVLGHGLWNSLALGAMVASMQAGGNGEGQPVGTMGSVLALGLILLFYGLVAVFAGLTRWTDTPERRA